MITLFTFYYILMMPMYSVSLSLITRYLEPAYLQMGSGIAMFLAQGITAVLGYVTGIMLNNLTRMSCVFVLFMVFAFYVCSFLCAMMVDLLGDKEETKPNGERRRSTFRRKTTSVFYHDPSDVRNNRSSQKFSFPS